ncbi:hypothetical protein EYF80_025086 [Liparis tanakae]|uniref:Uncharacterized protein n=1 Tax=Liparis tanakae TaxID=230148 RepID=A0A4Z2HFQ4_9TELE|nr:hypothetical protein EYF80_025086 [Liparis tanakae]
MDARSLLQGTRSGIRPRTAPDTSLHFDTNPAHTCPAAGQTHSGHLGINKESLTPPATEQVKNMVLVPMQVYPPSLRAHTPPFRQGLE